MQEEDNIALTPGHDREGETEHRTHTAAISAGKQTIAEEEYGRDARHVRPQLGDRA